MVYTVYTDLMFLLNAFYDFLLLYGVSRFSRRDCKKARLGLAAVLGGVYGALALFPPLAWLYNQLFVLAFPALLLPVAFGRLPGEQFLRLLLYCYLLSFAMNGIAAAGCNILNGLNISGEWLPVLGLPVCLILVIGKLGKDSFKKFIAKNGCFATGIIGLGGKTATVKVFLDTGNNLKEPLTGCPVLVAESRAVLKLLPKELQNEYEQSKKQNQSVVRFFDVVGAKYADTVWFSRLSLLPFRSVGKKQGFLPGFRADYFRLNNQSAPVVLALYDGSLDSSGRFNAIVSPWVFENEQAGRAQVNNGNNKCKAS